MPNVLRTGPYRIYFYSHEPNEPAHVARELRQIERLIREHRNELLEAWNGYFGIGG
jgi:hypothetical protein